MLADPPMPSRLRPAKIERFPTPLHRGGVSAEVRVVLACGCSLFLAVDDEGFPRVLARPCMMPHAAIVERALELLRESGLPPDPLAAADMLTQAQRQIREES